MADYQYLVSKKKISGIIVIVFHFAGYLWSGPVHSEIHQQRNKHQDKVYVSVKRKKPCVFRNIQLMRKNFPNVATSLVARKLKWK